MTLQGKRVEVPTHTDAWMRGDRYGEIVGTNGGKVIVRMDKSGRRLTFDAAAVTYV